MSVTDTDAYTVIILEKWELCNGGRVSERFRAMWQLYLVIFPKLDYNCIIYVHTVWEGHFQHVW